jgi:scavenger receptor class B, member 1
MSLKAHFVRKSSYAGLPTSIYTLDLGDFKVFNPTMATYKNFYLMTKPFQNDPRKHCFCHDPPEECPPKGTIDLMPCLGAPLYGKKVIIVS